MSTDELAVDMIVRQTGYEHEVARTKLAEHNGDAIAVMREYTRGPEAIAADNQGKTATGNSLNQRIYKEIRSLMDAAGKEHRKMQEAKETRHRALESFKTQARILASIADIPHTLKKRADHATCSLTVAADAFAGDGIPQSFYFGETVLQDTHLSPKDSESSWLVRIKATGDSGRMESAVLRAASDGAHGCIIEDDTAGECSMADAVTQARKVWPQGIIVAVAYPHGPAHTIHPVGDRQLTPLENGRVLRSRDDDGALTVCSDTEYAKSIQVLQDQEDAGADFALTEPFYDVGTFLRFIHATRLAGLHIKIIPTLHIISTATEFYKSAEERCIRVPPGVEATVARLSRGKRSEDASKLAEYGSALTITAAKALLLRGVQHIHFEAEAIEQAVNVVERLGLAKGSESSATAQEPPYESSG